MGHLPMIPLHFTGWSIMNKIIFTLVALFSCSSFSSEFKDQTITRLQIQKNARLFWTLYSENGISKIDLIEEKNNEAQQIINSWGFSNYDKARQFFNQKTKSLSELTINQWHSETLQVPSLMAKKLWLPTNTWNWDWELKYADWIATNVDKTFMQKYQIPSDCADLAYLLRWIFAREHSLPMATRLSATGKFMTHETVLKQWENLPTDPDWSKDKQFRAALKYMTGQTYTHTLMGDSYPVALNSEAFTEGVHHLQLREHSGHTMLVHRVDKSGGVPIQVLYSNMPIEIRELYETPFTDSGWPQEGTLAFLRFRWPQKTSSGWSLVSKNKMPFYSLEQFSEGLKEEGESFFLVAFKRISPNFDPRRIVQETIDSVFAQFANRVSVVEEGAMFCQSNNCEPGTIGDENWSTPSRDRRLRETLAALELSYSMYRKIVPTETMPAEFKNKFDAFRVNTNGKSIGFIHAYLSLMFEIASTDPRVSISERWALDMPTVLAQTEKKLTLLFSERDKKIQQTKPCTPTSCPWGSTEWINSSTADIDLKIGKTVSQLTNFCYLLSDDCTDLNSAISQSESFKKLLSRAITQQTSPFSSTEKKRGDESKNIAVTPGTEELKKISRNIYFQSGKVFEQDPNQYFPRILCNSAQLSIGLSIVCVQTVDGATVFQFFDSQMKPLKALNFDKENTSTIGAYGWVDQSDAYYIRQFNEAFIYAKNGDLIKKIDIPDYAEIKGQRWIYKLEDQHLVLDLKNIKNGWVAHDLPANDLGSAFQLVPLKFAEDRLLFNNRSMFILTNESGRRVQEINENIGTNINQYEFIVTTNNEISEKQTIRIYRYEAGSYRLKWEVPLKSDVKIDEISFQAVDSGFYFVYENLWSYVDIKTKKLESLDWLTNKPIRSLTKDFITTFFSESDSRQILWTRSGVKIFENDFIQISKDVINDNYSMGFFANKNYVTHIFKDPNNIADALFSNAGFTFAHPTKLTQPLENSPTYFFTPKGNSKDLRLLYWLGAPTTVEFSQKIID
jgi:hypothetical protein